MLHSLQTNSHIINDPQLLLIITQLYTCLLTLKTIMHPGNMNTSHDDRSDKHVESNSLESNEICIAIWLVLYNIIMDYLRDNYQHVVC